MKCFRCNHEMIEGKRYCADCGALNSEEARMQSMINTAVEAFHKKRDQKLLAVETADTIYKAVMFKLAPIGVAFAIVIGAVGWAGLNKYENIAGVMEKATQDGIQAIQTQTQSDLKDLHQAAVKQKETLNSRAHDELASLHTKSVVTTERYTSTQQVVTTPAQQVLSSSGLYTPVSGVSLGSTSNLNSYVTGLTGSATLDSVGNISTLDLRTYTVGDNGPKVKAIQTRLQELGCYSGNLSGDYDQKTQEAVVRFNRYRGESSPQGYVDPMVWMSLFSPIISSPRVSVTSTSTTTMPSWAIVQSSPAIGAVQCPSDN